ncbi:Hypothetical protein IALB_1227 [Ignavibacterium album JCM 16511]|uniref:Uncharacterized protein n=1 Tax=Ignavibacterium album (strain DSM 19864 / JCM 16511 / NBRC 101810 / Mat9-16) TaxID=945713 RepID=I0AIY1_IGNAJ|nr:hypothetical protein [Ignavibacterium album]AFH48938.1 Hypothetical protein IALB_1227 [Ignavibacterium album JCM 16511]
MKTNLLNILSEILKEQLVKKNVESGRNLTEIYKATGVEFNKLVEILSGRSTGVTISDLNSIFNYCDLEIKVLVAMAKSSCKLSFEFVIDENLFSLN